MVDDGGSEEGSEDGEEDSEEDSEGVTGTGDTGIGTGDDANEPPRSDWRGAKRLRTALVVKVVADPHGTSTAAGERHNSTTAGDRAPQKWRKRESRRIEYEEEREMTASMLASAEDW